MKHFPIFNGRCYVVELPEGAHSPSVCYYSPVLWVYPKDRADDESQLHVSLPAGTWQIVGRLSEVADDDVSDLTGHYYNKHNERYVDFMNSTTRVTPIDDIESAILAEGHTFTPSLTDIYDSESECMRVVESRVLSRERCLLLRRVGG